MGNIIVITVHDSISVPNDKMKKKNKKIQRKSQMKSANEPNRHEQHNNQFLHFKWIMDWIGF